MKMNCDTAHKKIKRLQEDMEAVIKMESQAATYSHGVGEEVEAPEYDLVATQQAIQEFQKKIQRIKHAISMFNVSTEIEIKTTEGIKTMTIDEALVRMPMLSRQKEKLNKMRQMAETTRESSFRGDATLIERNFAIDDAKVWYDLVSDELQAIQQAVSIANYTKEFEVEI